MLIIWNGYGNMRNELYAIHILTVLIVSVKPIRLSSITKYAKIIRIQPIKDTEAIA